MIPAPPPIPAGSPDPALPSAPASAPSSAPSPIPATAVHGGLRVARLTLFPVKGLRGIDVAEHPVETRGLVGDRRFMLVDAEGQFVSQRTHPAMARIEPALPPGPRFRGPGADLGGRLVLRHPGHGSVEVPAQPGVTAPSGDPHPRIPVTIWGDRLDAVAPSPEADAWLSALLGTPVRLVWQPDDAVRPTDPAWAPGHAVSLADGYPILVVSEASLDDLNARIARSAAAARNGAAARNAAAARAASADPADPAASAVPAASAAPGTPAPAEPGRHASVDPADPAAPAPIPAAPAPIPAAPAPIPMDRFRPNVVVAGAAPYAEDRWRRLRLGPVEASGVKRCARCTVTTVDQASGARPEGEAGKEPLRTLATYRASGGKVFFGQNLVVHVGGVLRVGDPVRIDEVGEVGPA